MLYPLGPLGLPALECHRSAVCWGCLLGDQQVGLLDYHRVRLVQSDSRCKFLLLPRFHNRLSLYSTWFLPQFPPRIRTNLTRKRYLCSLWFAYNSTRQYTRLHHGYIQETIPKWYSATCCNSLGVAADMLSADTPLALYTAPIQKLTAQRGKTPG